MLRLQIAGEELCPVLRSVLYDQDLTGMSLFCPLKGRERRVFFDSLYDSQSAFHCPTKGFFRIMCGNDHRKEYPFPMYIYFHFIIKINIHVSYSTTECLHFKR